MDKEYGFNGLKAQIQRIIRVHPLKSVCIHSIKIIIADYRGCKKTRIYADMERGLPRIFKRGWTRIKKADLRGWKR